jgi:hypothetical protein
MQVYRNPHPRTKKCGACPATVPSNAHFCAQCLKLYPALRHLVPAGAA